MESTASNVAKFALGGRRPSVSFSPHAILRGGAVSVSGGGFSPSAASVSVRPVDPTITTTVVATLGTAPSRNGSFGPASFTLPSNVAAGSYRIQASDGTITAISAGILTVTAPAATYSISGQVRKYKFGGGGDPVPGASVCDGAGHCKATDRNGNYTLTGLPLGTYTITPSKPGDSFKPGYTYTFFPASRTINLSGNVTDQDFTGFDRPPIVFVHGWQGFSPIPLTDSECDQANPDATFGGIDKALREAGYHIEYAHLLSAATSSCQTSQPRECTASS